MMNYILGAEGGSSSWIILVVLAVLMVGMMLLSVIPQKKRQKKAQEMMNSIRVGAKVKTIGGFTGTVKAIDGATNSFVLDLSQKEDGSMLVTIDKTAIYTVLVANNEGELVPQEEKKDEVFAADDLEANEKAEAKKKKKNAKNDTEGEAEDVAGVSIEKSDADADIDKDDDIRF